MMPSKLDEVPAILSEVIRDQMVQHKAAAWFTRILGAIKFYCEISRAFVTAITGSRDNRQYKGIICISPMIVFDVPVFTAKAIAYHTRASLFQPSDHWQAATASFLGWTSRGFWWIRLPCSAVRPRSC
jgi:hypothetical protein